MIKTILRPSATSTGEVPRSFPLPSSYSLAATACGRVCILLLYLRPCGCTRFSGDCASEHKAPAPKPPAPLPKDICEAGTFCNVACAQKYANFDAAKGCANAAKGYCCEDTKPANYPFTPAA